MLSFNDKDFVKNEKKIIGISTLLNPKEFVKAIRPFFPSEDIESARLTYIRYKPFRKCLVKYQLTMGGKTYYVYAKAYSPYKFIKSKNVNDPQFAKSEIRQGKFTLKDKGIVVSIFPSDSNLKSLKKFNKLKSRHILFKQLFPNRPELWKGNLQTLSYKPERRFVAGIKTKNGIEAVLKIYSPNGYPKAKNKALALMSNKDLQIPKCLGWLDKENVLVFEWLPGKTLNQLLTEDFERTLQIIKKAGYLLAFFHSQDIKDIQSQNNKEESLDLLNQADYVGFLFPNIASKAKKLARFLVSKLVLEPNFKNLTHGNFIAKNVIVNNGNVDLIDFDETILGDPRTDLGSIISSLQIKVVTEKISEKQFQELKKNFLESYQTQIGKKLIVNLDLFIAVALFQRVLIPFKNLEPNWKTKSETILEKIELITKNHFPKDWKNFSVESDRDTNGGYASLFKKQTIVLDQPSGD